MKRLSCPTLLIVGIATVGSLLLPREATAQWTDVACTESKLSLAGTGLTCRKGPREAGSGGTCQFDNYQVFGTRAGVFTNSYLYLSATAPERCHVTATAAARFEQTIKAGSWVKSNAKEFAAVRGFQGGHAMNFTTNNDRKCIAYHQPGPAQGAGFAYSQTGFFCGPANRDFGDEQLSALLPALKVSR